MRITTKTLSLLLCCGLWSAATQADRIGEVSTKFKLLGPNDKIVIEAFQDPDVPGVACYLSRAKTGGFSGAIGIAEDTSDASIECGQIGPIELPEDVLNSKRDGEDVFRKRTSIFFKKLQVVRFFDAPRNVLVYLSYSDKLIEGSPKNSISIVPVAGWQTKAPPGAPPAEPSAEPAETPTADADSEAED